MKKEIENREDIIVLVNSFYDKVRQHPTLGPFFNEEIKINWDTHLPIMYDFWESNLFSVNKYKGNPVVTHQSVDKVSPIEQKHFGHWLQLWFNTLDEHFEGQNADTLKSRARNMSHMLFMKIFQGRM
ncbi:group III truncated hemoglobin [Flammeovirga yaeyamensis]|uniref:Group III truncated hemoglobin n=1 Tax=Flammeovirga yaeyamensis TaxID=367791 RepID=A0AAX1N094_9BACT|nr:MULTISPECIES: group III truncated hemoglobin [Flammeovirga]ANQ47677.1 group III truncated hemoglobin [Flammeovirga sp. MY04]MBB3700133.1 hemoglobin [Flammeovirga yaeyamensis]NMF37236.1 group III truncated hemoglobin [Flammeovirga yaeyamensis]QWG00924.1 group III truncated hemoglobin [Flammeovirga yaeyamensis]